VESLANEEAAQEEIANQSATIPVHSLHHQERWISV
jgi:hypothetical protein